MPAVETVVLALPTPVASIRHARSTVLIGSIATVKSSGRFDDYSSRLPPAHREVLLNLVAGTWVPVNIALSHYKACETLGFSQDVQVANGRATFDRTSGTLLGTVIRMAKEAGVSPWTIFPQFQRFWSRGYDGNGLAVYRVGPKEAHLDVVQTPLAESRYYRNALRGLLLGVTDLFCTKSYATERPGPRPAHTVMLRLQWA